MRTFTLLLLMLCSIGASAQIYVAYDAKCVDRYEYQFTNRAESPSFVTYCVKSNATEKAFLEVGVENNRIVNAVPGRLTPCKNLAFDSEMVRYINNGTMKVFVVRQVADGYAISPVTLASYMSVNDGQLVYETIDGSISGTISSLGGGQNLASATSNTQVFFGGNDYTACREVYSFQRVPLETCKPATQFTLEPSLGVMQEKSGLDDAEMEENALRLVSINNIATDNYLVTLCEDKVPTASNAETIKNIEQVAVAPATEIVERAPDVTDERVIPAEYSSITKPISKEIYSIECPEKSSAGIHIVQENDNLYAIARRNGITLSQIRAWNSLTNDQIQICDKLIVTAPKEYYSKQTVSIAKPVVPPTTTPKPSITGGPKASAATPKPTVKVVAVPKATPPTAAPKKTTAPAPNKAIASSKPAVNKTAAKPAPVKATPTTPKKTAVANSTSEATKGEKRWLNGKGYHVVQKGETIYSIAKQYGFTEERFRTMNNLKGDGLIKIGQQLVTTDCVCDAVTQKPISIAPKEKPTSYGIVSADRGDVLTTKGDDNSTLEPRAYYIVTEEDTLWSIAQKHNLSVEVLRKMNDFGENDVVIPYQKVFVTQ